MLEETVITQRNIYIVSFLRVAMKNTKSLSMLVHFQRDIKLFHLKSKPQVTIETYSLRVLWLCIRNSGRKWNQKETKNGRSEGHLQKSESGWIEDKNGGCRDEDEKKFSTSSLSFFIPCTLFVREGKARDRVLRRKEDRKIAKNVRRWTDGIIHERAHTGNAIFGRIRINRDYISMKLFSTWSNSA